MRLLVSAILLAGCISCRAADPVQSLSATSLLQKDVKELEGILASADRLMQMYEQEVIHDPPRRIPSDAKVDLVADIMIRQIEIWRLRQKDHERVSEIKQPSLTITTSLKTPEEAQQGVGGDSGKAAADGVPTGAPQR